MARAPEVRIAELALKFSRSRFGHRDHQAIDYLSLDLWTCFPDFLLTPYRKLGLRLSGVASRTGCAAGYPWAAGLPPKGWCSLVAWLLIADADEPFFGDFGVPVLGFVSELVEVAGDCVEWLA